MGLSHHRALRPDGRWSRQVSGRVGGCPERGIWTPTGTYQHEPGVNAGGRRSRQATNQLALSRPKLGIRRRWAGGLEGAPVASSHAQRSQAQCE